MKARRSVALALVWLLTLLSPSARAQQRDYWKHERGHFERIKGKQWREKFNKATFHYVQTTQNKAYIELFDKSRNFTVRIYTGHYAVKVNRRFQRRLNGRWMARVAGRKKEIVNSVGMKLARIPAGTFTMGSPKDEKGRSFYEHQHEVRISRPFYMGIYPVTQAQYQKIMGSNPSYFSATGVWKRPVSGLDTSRFPVEAVTWHEAVKFCEKLSALPAEKRAGRTYRLPTEAEWEYACRAGTTTPFAFGTSLSNAQANFGAANRGKGVLVRTCTVGSYKPNAWGLCDMHGNVWQWCSDWYSLTYYKSSPKEDPQGPEKGTSKVLRGGSWADYARACRSAFRHQSSPTSRAGTHGFRIVCVVSKAP